MDKSPYHYKQNIASTTVQEGLENPNILSSSSNAMIAELDELCEICDQYSFEMYCVPCATRAIQQKDTILAALKADVAVLKRRSNSIIQNKDKSQEKGAEMSKAVQKIEEYKKKLLIVREKLCSERIVLAQRKFSLEERMEKLQLAKEQLKEMKTQLIESKLPVVTGLERVAFWGDEEVLYIRKKKIKQIFDIIQVVIPEVKGKHFDPSTIPTIAGLPMLRSCCFSVIPREVGAAALGRIVHLLCLIGKYLKLDFLHPMSFTGSFSTIGSVEDGESCQTLFPDGSFGFEQGLQMLQENILQLCSLSGLDKKDLKPEFLLDNLWYFCESSLLTECAQVNDISENVGDSKISEQFPC